MNLFITGATGFIGKHLVNRLLNEKHNVTINLYGTETSPFGTEVKTYQLSENDIAKDIQYFNDMAFDGIIHLASLYLTVHKPNEAVKLIDSNVRFSTHVIECGAQAKVKWFLNTGTFWQNYQNADYSPVNLYAATKQAFETIARYYIETRQIHFCTLRLSDTYGPNDTRPKIFNLWLKNAQSGELLEMSPGKQLIDISYIDDIVNAFYMLALHMQNSPHVTPSGEVFAVKANTRHTLKELSVIFEQATGLKLNIKWGGRAYRDREVMVPWEHGKVVPGWKPQVEAQQGLARMLEWLNQ
jgi:CDP-paratose synthetase